VEEIDLFVKDNERLIWLSIIRQFESQHNAERIAKKHNMEIEDFVQLGRIGLWECKKNFDEDKGKFSTYAVKYIRYMYMKEIKRKGYLIKFPANHDIKSYKYNFVPGDKKMSDGEESIFSIISSGYDLQDEVTERLHYNQKILKVKEQIATLPPKDRDIMYLRLKGHTFDQIALKYNVSKQAVSVKHKNIIKKLKEHVGKVMKEEAYA
jgi:RNA polymerase sigma factor (sigma-70 family)